MKLVLLATWIILSLPLTALAQDSSDVYPEEIEPAVEDPGQDGPEDFGDAPEDLEEEEPDAALDADDPLPKNFTGTFDPEDEESPEFKRQQSLKEERELFGNDRRRRGPNAENDEEFEDDSPNYLLKLSFDSQLVFTDKEGQAYMEVNYKTTIEQEIALINRRWRSKGEAKFASDITGALAGNDLFTCKLDISIDTYGVDLMTRLKKIEETEETPESYEAALQIKLKKDYKENWHSLCTDTTGNYTFNTSGDPEKYNMTILENVTPGLHALTFKEFDPETGAELEIVSEPMEVEDVDLGETVRLSGVGSVTIEPL